MFKHDLGETIDKAIDFEPSTLVEKLIWAVANGEFWHSDVSCDETPPLGTMLQIHIAPPCGGDTMFSNMYSAYETLSEPVKRMLDGMTATHESEHIYKGRYTDRGQNDADIDCPMAVHPVVHPGGTRHFF